MAYLHVNIDNTQCQNPCSLIISQKTKLIQDRANGEAATRIWTHRKESFPLADAREQTQKILQFKIAKKRKKRFNEEKFGEKANVYHYINELVPESIITPAFIVVNYLELRLQHEKTYSSENAVKRIKF